MAWLLTTNRPFPSPPHTSNANRTSGWARGGRWGWRGCGGKSAYGQTKKMVSRKFRLNFSMAWLQHPIGLFTPRPTRRIRAGRVDGPGGDAGGGGGAAGRAPTGKQKYFFLDFFAATALLALAIHGLLTDMDRFQRVPVG